jgi:hypothetical protein
VFGDLGQDQCYVAMQWLSVTVDIQDISLSNNSGAPFGNIGGVGKTHGREFKSP